jgi:hypothetical protein
LGELYDHIDCPRTVQPSMYLVAASDFRVWQWHPGVGSPSPQARGLDLCPLSCMCSSSFVEIRRRNLNTNQSETETVPEILHYSDHSGLADQEQTMFHNPVAHLYINVAPLLRDGGSSASPRLDSFTLSGQRRADGERGMQLGMCFKFKTSPNCPAAGDV